MEVHMGEFAYPPVNFETHPDTYVHWDLDIEGSVATLTMHIKEDHPMWEGLYDLKLNSYDLAVDIELHDAVNRLRFEHPEVRCVVLTGAYDKIFCAGANIRFLGNAPHAFKVNFCKYTNETRCGIEDATEQSGLVFMAALNGTASGGGYELALACKEIYLIDDGNAAVALPEVPLLGVLPGTGGLTRLTDKRKIRRDMSDVFCTKAEGFRARDAKKYNFIDGSFPRSKWKEGIANRAVAIVEEQAEKFPNRKGPGVVSPALSRTDNDNGWSYRFVDVDIDGRVANILLKGPTSAPERGADTWSLLAFRELEDALLQLRINHLEVGLVNLRTKGDGAKVLEHEAFILEGAESDWFLAEIKHFQHQCLRRLDNMAKSTFALIETGHCFVGTLFELALSADRIYMFMDDDGENTITISEANNGLFKMANGMSRLQARFPGEPNAPSTIMAEDGPIDAETADELGLVTAALDDIDWDDEVRIAMEERISMSPDALTGMEQNLRFGGHETCETKIYGRLSAWQNWIFQRPNAVGDRGALTLYGHPERPVFDFRRT
jgi:benzoyl-CoA-dihydrodiol lyase